MIDHRAQLAIHAFFMSAQTATANGLIIGEPAKWVALLLAFMQTVLGIYGIYTPAPKNDPGPMPPRV